MIHFITYGNNLYEKSKKKLCQEAQQSRWFNTVTLYGPNDLTNDFKEKFKNILEMPRGVGYWIWKIDIIEQKIKDVNDNDIIVYMDAGCTINKRGEKRFYEYIDMLENSGEGMIGFQMHCHIEKIWTTKEIFDYFKVELGSRIANSGQFIGGIMILKKCKKTDKMLKAWKNVCESNSLLITDHYNSNQDKKFFRDNRHDQSILSIIKKLHGVIELSDETWFNKFGKGESLKYPFWATRRCIK